MLPRACVFFTLVVVSPSFVRSQSPGELFQSFYAEKASKLDGLFGCFAASVETSSIVDGEIRKGYVVDLQRNGLFSHVNLDGTLISLQNSSYTGSVRSEGDAFRLARCSPLAETAMDGWGIFEGLDQPILKYADLGKPGLPALTTFEETDFNGEACIAVSFELPIDGAEESDRPNEGKGTEEKYSVSLYFAKNDGRILGNIFQSSLPRYCRHRSFEYFLDENRIEVTTFRGNAEVTADAKKFGEKRIYRNFDPDHKFDESIVYLTHYGLPEPPFSDKGKWPSGLLILVGVLGCAATLVGIRMIRK